MLNFRSWRSTSGNQPSHVLLNPALPTQTPEDHPPCLVPRPEAVRLRLARAYGKIAVIAMNLTLAFVLLNCILYVFYPVQIADRNVLSRWYEEHRWLDKFS